MTKAKKLLPTLIDGSRGWLDEHAPKVAASPYAMDQARALAAFHSELNRPAASGNADQEAGTGELLWADLARFRARRERAAGIDPPYQEDHLVALLGAGEEGHRRAVAEVEAAPSATADQPLAGDLMAGAALKALRAFDLLLGVRAARVSRWLRGPVPAFDATIVNFIQTHRTPAGAFLSEEQIRRPARDDAALAFVLTASANFHCLWTFAELSGASGGTRRTASKRRQSAR